MTQSSWYTPQPDIVESIQARLSRLRPMRHPFAGVVFAAGPAPGRGANSLHNRPGHQARCRALLQLASSFHKSHIFSAHCCARHASWDLMDSHLIELSDRM